MDKNNCDDAKTGLQSVKEKSKTSDGKEDGTSKRSQTKCAGVKYREVETLDLPGQEGPVKNTIHATKFGMKLFSEWCAKNNHNIDLENISDDKLNDILSDFFTNVRTQEGKRYSESSLVNFKYSIQRYMSSLPETSKKDLKGPHFYRANNVLLKLIREMRASEADKNIPLKIAMVYLTTEDIIKMYESGVFNTSQPISLLHKVWFEVCLHFCRKNREVQRQMNPDLFEFAVDESGRRYVYYKKVLGHKNSSSNKDMYYDPKSCRMVEVRGHPMCPVRSLEKYLSKIKHLTKDGGEPCLFYRPRSLWDKQSKDAKWYTTLPVGKNALSSFMASISTEAKLSQVYTPIVMKTLPVSKWREIVFESSKQCEAADNVTLDTVSAVQSQNIIPIQPYSLSNYLGNIMVSQQQFNMQNSFGTNQQLVSIKGSGDASLTAHLNFPNISGLPLTISPAATRPYLTANTRQFFPAGNGERLPLFGNSTCTLVKPKPIYATALATSIGSLLLPNENNSTIAQSALSTSLAPETTNNSYCSSMFENMRPEILSNPIALENKAINQEKKESKTSMSYVEAKHAVKKIFDQLDYWALADLVNWMKRVDVLKDTSGKVVCNDPLCKPATTAKKAFSRMDKSSEDKTEMESCGRNTTVKRSTIYEEADEKLSQNRQSSRTSPTARSEDVEIVADSYLNVTPENKAMKPSEVIPEEPYHHIPRIQLCSRLPGKLSSSVAHRVPAIMCKSSTKESSSLITKQVPNTPQAFPQDARKSKSMSPPSLSVNPHYRQRKQVYPLHMFQNSSSKASQCNTSFRSLIRDESNNKKTSSSASSQSKCLAPSSRQGHVAPPESKRRKLHFNDPQTNEKSVGK